MEPSSQPSPQPMQPEPQPQPAAGHPQPQRDAASTGRPRATGVSERPWAGPRAVLYGALLIGALAVGAFGSGLINIPGLNQSPAPTVTATQTTPGPIDEQDKVHWIGVQIQNLTGDFAKSIGSSRVEGLAVRTVRANSPAAEAGLHPDDIIIAADGVPLRNVNDLANKIKLTTVGELIALTLERNGAVQSTAVRVSLVNRCQHTGSPLCSY